MKSEIVQILVDRDGMSLKEAIELLEEARAEVADVGDPEEILEEYFGLEPDYILELL